VSYCQGCADLQSRYDAAYGIIRGLEAKLAAAEAALEICRLYLISGYKPNGKKVSLREAIDAARGENP
jgi:hypothetical protein